MVRVAECERPRLLAGVVGVDLFDRSESQTKARLRKMVADAIADRAKPSRPPAFPSAQRAVSRPAVFPGALPPVSNVPARNPHFTGRANDLERLAEGFDTGQTLMVHALHGMGGVGKTQLATEYAHVHASNYQAIWWINAEDPTLVPQQLAKLATKLGHEPSSVEDDVIRDATHEALAGTSGWLLIFDNAENVDVVTSWTPPAAPGAGIPGHDGAARPGRCVVGRVAIVVAPVLAIGAGLLMTLPADLNGTSRATPAACHVALVPIAVAAMRALTEGTACPAVASPAAAGSRAGWRRVARAGGAGW